MSKYRRIEINAYHRSVTVVSGAWRADELIEPTPAHTDDEVSLNNAGADEPVGPDSPEGQMILAEAVRALERRLSPEARALIRADSHAVARANPNQNRFLLWMRATNGLRRRLRASS